MRAAAFLLAAVLLPASAAAHAVVYPKRSTPGAYERYMIRVPNERDVPTTRIEITFPEDVTVVSFMEVPGWTLTPVSDTAGRFTGAVWTGKIGVDRFVELPFVAVNPDRPTTIVWRVAQTYASGERVEWSGPEDSETPASTTEVRNDGAGPAAWLAAAALVLALIALGLALRPRAG